MIRIGQIGLGHSHGEGKMLAVRKYPEFFEPVGYAEENDDLAARRGGLPAYADLPRMQEEELIEKSDAVLVECGCQEKRLTQTARRCIEAGKHVHLDKPANGTVEEFKALLDCARTRKRVLQLGYMYRYNPAVKRCIMLAKEGQLGEIYSINAEMSTFHTAEGRKKLGQYNGATMYIMGSHLIDLIVFLLGEPEKVTTFFKKSGLGGIEVPDNDLAVLEYSRALARVFTSSVEINGWGRRQLVVSGSRGTVSILPLENQTVMTYSDLNIAVSSYEDMKQKIEIADIPKNCRYDEMMRDFHDYIIGIKKNPYSYEHDLSVHRVITRICGIND